MISRRDMDSLTRAEVLALSCPTCRAAPGDWCNPRINAVCMARLAAAERDARTTRRANAPPV